MTITKESLLSLEAYAKIRKSEKPKIIAHRKLRTVHLGEHVSVQFEDETTIRRQIQEMLHIEKIFDEDGINSEIEAYQPLVPDGSNWKATMLIEYPDVAERQAQLAVLRGIEDKVWIEVAGHARVYAIADEDMDRSNDEKTSAVHFLRFELTPPMIAAMRADSDLAIGVAHPAYAAQIDRVPLAVRSSLAGDLRS